MLKECGKEYDEILHSSLGMAWVMAKRKLTIISPRSAMTNPTPMGWARSIRLTPPVRLFEL